jgi:hypothetical protein
MSGLLRHLQGVAVTQPRTKFLGCLIGRRLIAAGYGN